MMRWSDRGHPGRPTGRHRRGIDVVRWLAGGRRWPRGPLVTAAALVVVTILVVGLVRAQSPGQASRAGSAMPVPASGSSAGSVGQFTFARAEHPARTLVRDAGGTTVAVLTDGSRTVWLTGPARTFVEPAFTTASVTTDAWVRIAPRTWRAGGQREDWFGEWLGTVLADTGPDVFAVAMQYLHGTPALRDAAGVRVAGDASFGPPSAADPDGRQENSDFVDYLGLAWSFPDAGLVRPKPDRYGAVDCSGFLRLVYGYRLGYPLLGRNTPGAGLPRRAYAMAAFGPGVLVIGNTGRPPTDLSPLQPGDLVFFDTALDGSGRTDHSGIYLGLDNEGHHRFISSRSRANGPTIGDLGGVAILDGTGYWAVRFRAARRI